MKSWAGPWGILFAITLSLSAEVEDDIFFGIEAVTGLRTNYVHRGFELAETSLDFQMEAEVSLSDASSLHLGLSHLAESSDDFSETSAYAEYSHSLSKKHLIGASLTYRDRNASILDSGLDLGLFSSFTINDDWRWRNELNYDFGESGIYFASELEWSHVVSEKSFVTIEGGISFVSDYLDRNGFNDFYTRLTFTYAISDRVAITPFLGASLTPGSDSSGDTAYGGFWFEVIF